MQIHALTTGTVRLKHAFLHARQNWRRQVDLFLPGEWSDPVPIHCWAIEHAERLWLVDTGETAGVRDIPFARFDVRPDQELPGALAGAGFSIDDVDTVVLTHMHGDHMDGGIHVRGPVLVNEADLAFTRTPAARILQRMLHQPVPTGVEFQAFTLDAGPFGSFTNSHRLSDDGRIVAVSTPGHTVGHISVLCVDDDGRHVLLAGDVSDSEEQLRALRPGGADAKPKDSITSMRTILAHAKQHPTVYLPSHDPETVTRLADRTSL